VFTATVLFGAMPARGANEIFLRCATTYDWDDLFGTRYKTPFNWSMHVDLDDNTISINANSRTVGHGPIPATITDETISASFDTRFLRETLSIDRVTGEFVWDMQRVQRFRVNGGQNWETFKGTCESAAPKF
jgi:hypothetical protein